MTNPMLLWSVSGLLLVGLACGADPAPGDTEDSGDTTATTSAPSDAPTAPTGTDSAGLDSTTASTTTPGSTGETGADEGSSSGESTGPQPPPATLCSGATMEHSALQYADDDPQRNLVDLYVHEDGGPCPLLLWVHGGAWLGGSRQLGGPIANRLFRQRDRGYAVASMDYRLSSDALFPAQIYDVKAALRWLRANADRYNIDPTRIAVMGASAGGHLVALAGTSGGVEDLEDLTQGNPGESSEAQAVIDCYGPTDFAQMDPQLADNGCGPGTQTHSAPSSPESMLLGCAGGLASCPDDVARANPITYVDAGDPPFIIGHGAQDCTVPPGQSTTLDQALQADSVPSTLYPSPGTGHEIASCPPDEVIDQFLDEAFGIER